MMRRLQRRLRYLANSGERARLLQEEMEIHLDMKTQELMEDGMTEPDAYSAARRQFGNPTLRQEESRGTWIARWLREPSASSLALPRSLSFRPRWGSGRARQSSASRTLRYSARCR